MKKRTIGIIGGLAGLIAGAVLCSRSPEPQYPIDLITNPVPSLYAVRNSQEQDNSISKPTYSKRIGAEPQQKPQNQVPFTGYKLIHESQPAETFYVGDTPEIDLFDMFKSDCLGRCIYVRGEDGNISKHLVAEGQSEPLLWYDHDWSQTGDGSARFQGNNFWLYVGQDGKLKGWGTGLDEKKSAENLLNPKTE